MGLPLPLHVLGDVPLLREFYPKAHLLKRHETVAVLKVKIRYSIVLPSPDLIKAEANIDFFSFLFPHVNGIGGEVYMT